MKLTLLCILISLPAAFAQRKTNPATAWPMYSRDLTGQRFSPLKQINTSNVANLKQAWTAQIRGTTGSPAAQITPIVVNGVMYLPAATRILALEAHTGKQLWSFDMPPGFIAPARGLAYWPGDANNPPRIVFTNGGDLMSSPVAAAATAPEPATKMAALNANTGKIDPGFGREGIVDLEVCYSGTPTIFKNLIILGAAVP